MQRSAAGRWIAGASVLAAASLTSAGAIAEPVFEANPWVDGAVDVALWGATLAMHLGEDALLDRPCGPERPCSPEGLHAIDRLALGKYQGSTTCTSCDLLMTGTLVAAPVLEIGRLAAGASGWEELGTFALVYLQAVGVASFTVKGLKLLVHRPMPFVYDYSPEEQGRLDLFDYQAFPSGHAAHAFAGAGVFTFMLARRHGSAPVTFLAGGVAHGMALATGIIKVAVGIHYPSDVLVGALIGEAAALGVSWLHAAPEPEPGKPTLAAAPGAVSLRFAF